MGGLAPTVLESAGSWTPPRAPEDGGEAPGGLRDRESSGSAEREPEQGLTPGCATSQPCGHQPGQLGGWQGALPAQQHLESLSASLSLQPGALPAHLPLPIPHPSGKQEVGAASSCPAGLTLPELPLSHSISATLLFKPGCLGRDLVAFQHLETIPVAPAGAQRRWGLRRGTLQGTSITQRHFPAWKQLWEGCGSQNLQERSSGMDQDAKSSESLLWKAEPVSLGEWSKGLKNP